MYEKESIGLLYQGYPKTKSQYYSFKIGDNLLPDVSYICVFDIWRSLAADKTHFRQIISTGMVYSYSLLS